jgi:hypothetical protein
MKAGWNRFTLMDGAVMIDAFALYQRFGSRHLR